jgi:hypothetical protein
VDLRAGFAGRHETKRSAMRQLTDAACPIRADFRPDGIFLASPDGANVIFACH